MSTNQAPTRAARHKRQNLFRNDLRNLLYASGDLTPQPLEETLRILEEITVTYVTDTCLAASTLASAANRTKIKVDDFKFALRRDSKKLGRVQELLVMKKVIDDLKKLDGLDGGENAASAANLAGEGGGSGGKNAAGGGRDETMGGMDDDQDLDSSNDDDGGDGDGPSKKKKKKKKGKKAGKAKSVMSVKSSASKMSGLSGL